MPNTETIIARETIPSEDTLVWESEGEDLYELSGAERKNFLNSYVTQDIKNLAPDRIAPAAFLTQKGKLVSPVQVLNLSEKIWLIFPKNYGKKTEAHLSIYLMFASVSLHALGETWGHFAVWGPKARELCEIWLGNSLNPEKQAIHHASLGSEEILLFQHPDFAERWDIFAPASLKARLRAQFEDWQGRGVALAASPEVLERRRIEAGIPKMGQDMNEDNLVAEVGLDRAATSFNKGCYLGQETTARVQSRGHVNRQLLRVKLDQAFSDALPVEILQGEKKVGTLTSIEKSSRFSEWVGLAMLSLSARDNPDPLYIPQKEGNIYVHKI